MITKKEKYDSLLYRLFSPDIMRDYGCLYPWWKKNEIIRPVSFAFYLFCMVIIIIGGIAFLISPVSGMLNYSETLTIQGSYSISQTSSGSTGNINGFFDNWTGAAGDGIRWSVDTSGQSEGASTIIIQTNALSNMTDNFISSPFSLSYHGQTFMTGTISIANGSFAGKKYQIILYVSSYIKPAGASGLIDGIPQGVSLISYTSQPAGGRHVAFDHSAAAFNGFDVGGGKSGLLLHGNPVGINYCPSNSNYYNNYVVNIVNDLSFSQDNYQVVHIDVVRHNYNTQLNVFTPISSLAYSSGYTNNDTANTQVLASGKMIFQIQTTLGGGLVQNSSSYYGNNYTVSVNPHNMTLGTSTTVTLSSFTNTLSNINAWCNRYVDVNGNIRDFWVQNNAFEQLCWAKYSGTWYAWNSSTNTYSISKGATLPNGVNIYPIYAGLFTFHTYVYTTDSEAFDFISNVNISGNGQITTKRICNFDGTTNTPIQGQISVKDLNTNIWTNVTTDKTGCYDFLLPIGDKFMACSSNTGYITNCTISSINGQNTTPLNMPINPSNIVSNDLTKTNVQVVVTGTTDGLNYIPLENVQVNMYTLDVNETNNNQNLMTNKQGEVLFTTLNESTTTVTSWYTFTASKLGYETSIQTINPSGSFKQVYINMQASSLVSPVPTVIPTITQNPLPTISGIGTINSTYLPEVQCVDQSKATGGIFGQFRNFIACAGVTGAENQGIALSVIIMLLCAVGLSRYGKGLGALTGAIIGAIASWAAHLLPVWTMIIAIVICGLVFAALITKQSQ